VESFNTTLGDKIGYPYQKKKKINKETSELSNTIDQKDLTDIYRLFPLAAAQNTFFLTCHGSFSKIGHILGHNINLNKYKKNEIATYILSDHKGIKLEIKRKRETTGNTQTHGD
jgi:hypothetical protein